MNMAANNLPMLNSNWFMKNRLKLRHLNVLLTIERTRNIGRAALALHTSQPALSKALREIEAAAGMPLFERRPDGTYPTAAGLSLVHYARDVFGALDRAGRDLESIASEQSGRLAIGCNFSSAGQAVPRAIVLLKRIHPSLAVQIQEGSLEMLLPQLRSRKLDIVIARWPRGHLVDDLEEQALSEQAMCVVCAPGHPLTRSRTVNWQSLAQWPWIFPPQGSAVRDDLAEVFRLRRITPRQTGIECASIFANSVLLKELRAVAICPLSIARHFCAEKLLAILPVKLPRVFGPNSVITLKNHDHTPAMHTFIECLGKSSGKSRAATG